MSKTGRRAGDRKDGRLIRTISPITKFMPFVMPTKNDACNQYEESFEISALDRRLRQLRVEGYKGIGILHFFIAAYIRCISAMPGLNRFVAGRRIYAANDITVVMTVKREMALNADETTIKVHFQPSDTIFDVYRKLNAEIDKIKANDGTNNTEDVAQALTKLPRFVFRMTMGVLRIMDYFGWVPESLIEASPFHGSMIITDLGSLRIGPIYHHIYNFGTLPVFISFGAKRHAYEINRRGEVEDRKYVDAKMVMDERIADGHYYAQFLQAMRYMFQHPEIVENPPTTVIDDIF